MQRPEFYESYGQKVEHSKRTKTAAFKEAKAIAIGKGVFLNSPTVLEMCKIVAHLSVTLTLTDFKS